MSRSTGVALLRRWIIELLEDLVRLAALAADIFVNRHRVDCKLTVVSEGGCSLLLPVKHDADNLGRTEEAQVLPALEIAGVRLGPVFAGVLYVLLASAAALALWARNFPGFCQSNWRWQRRSLFSFFLSDSPFIDSASSGRR